jgi:hypothetical protein
VPGAYRSSRFIWMVSIGPADSLCAVTCLEIRKLCATAARKMPRREMRKSKDARLVPKGCQVGWIDNPAAWSLEGRNRRHLVLRQRKIEHVQIARYALDVPSAG